MPRDPSAIWSAAVSQSRFRNCLYTGTLKVTVVGVGAGVGVGVGVGLGVGDGWPIASRGAGVGRVAMGLYVGDASTAIAPTISANSASRKTMPDLMPEDEALPGDSPERRSGDCT